MWQELLTVFQGKEHEDGNAVTAAAALEKMIFIKNSCITLETFLAKISSYLKDMELFKEYRTVRLMKVL